MKETTIYYLEKFFAIMSVACLFISLIGIMLCFIRNDFRFGWITAALVGASLTFILLKIYLFND